MAATWTIAGVVIGSNGPVNGAIVYAWKAQRFSSVPSQNAAAPSGIADAGPITTGATYGGPGAYQIACPTNEAYYIAVTYGGNTYWTYVNDLNFTDIVETTVASGSTGQQIGSLTSSQLSVASTSGFNASGEINVTTSGGQAILAYTGLSGGNTFTGVSVVSGTATWTVSTGAAVTQTQEVSTLNQTIDDGSGDMDIDGNLTVGEALTVDGNATINGNLSVTANGNGVTAYNLTVQNTASFGGAVTINGRLTLNNNTAFGGHLSGPVQTTSTVGTTIGGLQFNIAANEVIYFEANILASSFSSGTTYGSKFALTNVPTGATGFFTVAGPVASGANTATQTTETTLTTLAGPFAETSTPVMLNIQGIVINGSTPGVGVGLLMAAATTTSTVTAATGSNIFVFQLS